MTLRTAAMVAFGALLIFLVVRGLAGSGPEGPSGEVEASGEAEAGDLGPIPGNGPESPALVTAPRAAQARGVGSTNFLPEEWEPAAEAREPVRQTLQERRLAGGMASGARRRLGNGTVVFDGDGR